MKVVLVIRGSVWNLLLHKWHLLFLRWDDEFIYILNYLNREKQVLLFAFSTKQSPAFGPKNVPFVVSTWWVLHPLKKTHHRFKDICIILQFPVKLFE